ncbi:EEF1A lysine methyltransferase 1 isoform X2 [Saccopteryx bilineata]|uniref:EEF1A lysine methyltransferase 1 isoform X2 n=1 Tax=Saccopteryx bilineata TaxID=59482 RepID=UPI00338E455D
MCVALELALLVYLSLRGSRGGESSREAESVSFAQEVVSPRGTAGRSVRGEGDTARATSCCGRRGSRRRLPGPWKNFTRAFVDWLSQFWYSPETALRLAKEVIAVAGEGGRIACVSTPTVYQTLRELHGDFAVCIFEYDRRFAFYGEEFVFYDYNNPLDLPEDIVAHSFDIVIADPPYLSEECLRKMSETIKYLTQGKVVLCTGAIMEEEAAKLLGVKMCKFIPKHARTLANEFRCYVNYDSGLDRDA